MPIDDEDDLFNEEFDLMDEDDFDDSDDDLSDVVDEDDDSSDISDDSDSDDTDSDDSDSDVDDSDLDDRQADDSDADREAAEADDGGAQKKEKSTSRRGRKSRASNGVVSSDGEGEAAGDEALDEYGRPKPTANYVVHIYEYQKFKRTLDRPFTPEDAEAFASEYNRTGKVYSRFAVAGKNDVKPKKSLD